MKRKRLVVFSSRLRSVLFYKNMTYYRLAKELGVVPSCVFAWIQGTREPSLFYFYRICMILEESPCYLLGIDESLFYDDYE